MKTLFLYVVVPVMLALLSIAIHPQRATWSPPTPEEGEVTLEMISNWHESVLWVDARASDQYVRSHIPEAISLNDENFENQLSLLLERWQPEMKVVVYCDTAICDASHAMAGRLKREVGLTEVWVLYGGWNSWVESK